MAATRRRTTSTTRRATRTTEAPVCLVKVAKVGGQVREFALNGDRTVAESLRLAGITVGTGMRVRVGSRVAELGTTLRNGDIVTVSEKVQGGR